MEEATIAHVTVEACNHIIDKLGNYATQLEEFDKNIYASLEELNQTHRDQNYGEFYDKFSPLWDDIKPFKEKVESFKNYIETDILPGAEDYEDTKPELQ